MEIIQDSYNKMFLHDLWLLYSRAHRDTCTLDFQPGLQLSHLELIADFCRCSHFGVSSNLKADVLALRQLAAWLVGKIRHWLSRGNRTLFAEGIKSKKFYYIFKRIASFPSKTSVVLTDHIPFKAVKTVSYHHTVINQNKFWKPYFKRFFFPSFQKQFWVSITQPSLIL